MFYLPECSPEERELLISTCTARNGVFSKNIRLSLDILVKEVLEEGTLYEQFEYNDFFGKTKRERQKKQTEFITINLQRYGTKNDYGKSPASIYKYWNYKENDDIRWLAIPNPLYYSTFIYNILTAKPLMISMYNFFDSVIKTDNIKVISRFITDEEYTYYNWYTDEDITVREGELRGNESILEKVFEKNKNNDVDLRISSLYHAKVDIQDYYNSIYVHEITRLQKRKMFATFLDEITTNEKQTFIDFLNVLELFNQNLNNCQTNGIITGPYSSYITGELILLSIDYELNEFLKEINSNGKSRLKYSRFADDYSIYTDERDLIFQFIDRLELILKKYSLKLNRQKIEMNSPGIFDRTPESVRKHYEEIFLQIVSGDKQQSQVFLEIDYIVDELAEKFSVKSAKNIITNTYKKIKECNTDDFFNDLTETANEKYAVDFIKLMINKAILYPKLGKKLLIFTMVVVKKIEGSNFWLQIKEDLKEFFKTRNDILSKMFGGSENQYYFLELEEIIYPDTSVMIDIKNETFIKVPIVEKTINELACTDINIVILEDNSHPF